MIETTIVDAVEIMPSGNSVCLLATEQPSGQKVRLRLASPYVGNGTGLVALPKPGDEVYALYPGGDKSRGVALVGVYHGNSKVPAGAAEGLVLIEGRPGDDLRVHVRGKVEMVIDRTLDVLVMLDEARRVLGSRSTTVTVDESKDVLGKESRYVALTDSLTVLLSQDVKIGANQDVWVVGMRTERIGVSDERIVVGSDTQNIMAAQTITVGGARTINVAGSRVEEIAAFGYSNALLGNFVTSEVLVQLASAGLVQMNAPQVIAGTPLATPLTALGVFMEALWEVLRNHTHPGVGSSPELDKTLVEAKALKWISVGFRCD
jgi:type VI secretion system secreted protein VgrG